MYSAYFGLSEPPFSIAPDPQYLYMSDRHREAMAHLLFGIKGGNGFVVLAGDVGTGKTTLCRCLLEQIPEDVDVALILNSRQNENELLQTICDELDIETPPDAGNKQLLDALNTRLLESFSNGRTTVLVIDEAQLLSYPVLEQVRLLTNLETTKHKLLQIILIGQPELNDLLAKPELKQLGQRVTARYFLGPLEEDDTAEYIRYRLSVAGRHDAELFHPEAKRLIHHRSGGVPRLINVLCDRALLGAYAEGKNRVDRELARQAVSEVNGGAIPTQQGKSRSWWLPALIAAVVAAGLGWGISSFYHQQSQQVAAPTNSPTASAPAQDTVVAAEAMVPDEVEQTKTEPNSPLPGADFDQQQDGLEVTTASNIVIATKPEVDPLADEESSEAPVVAVSDESETGPGGETARGDSSSFTDAELVEAVVSDQQDKTIAEVTKPLSQVLLDQQTSTARQHAFKYLLNSWQGEPIDSSLANRCQLVQLQGLRCWGGVGTIADLSRLNRPALIVLKQNGREYRVVMESLTEDGVVMQVGESSQRYPISEIEQLWAGRYLILWRPPVDKLLIGPDSSGPEVVWLRQILHQLENDRQQTANEEASFGPNYDSDLMQLVRLFQSNHGLIVDGVVGLETFLKINSLVYQSTTPLLIQPLQ